MHASDQQPKRHREPSQQQVALHIAAQLQVRDEQGQAQILSIVQNLGRTQAQQLAEEALQEEVTKEGSPPHDVFLHLVQTKGKPKDRAGQRDNGAAGRIAEQLGEIKEVPVRQIQHIVRILGEEQAQHYLEETLRIEEAGGLLLADGSRRRTPGGVYFYLVKRALPPQTRHKIFPHTGKQRAEGVHRQASPAHQDAEKPDGV